jgi:hypothetical protein
MRRSILYVAGLLVLLTAACNGLVIGERGSGVMAKESRTVSGFTNIDLSGSGRVNVSVTGSESLTIEAEDNILPLLTSEVRNGRLVLGSKGNISPSVEVVYTITMSRLEGVAISGSGTVNATGIDSSAFDADISGSGEIFPSGRSTALALSISGSGRYSGEALISTSGSVHVSGSGSALVNVTDDLEVSVSGSGDVKYIGDPAMSASISGSGHVSKR